MLANLIILPFVLYYLDGDSIGLYYIFISLSALTNLFDLGFSPSIARSLAYAWSGSISLKAIGTEKSSQDEPNFLLMKQIVHVCKIIYLVLSSASLLLSLTLGTFYVNYISLDVSGNVPLISWLIYSVAIFVNLLFGYYSVLLRGVGAVTEVNKVTVFSRIIQIGLSASLLYLGLGLIGVALAYLVYGTLFRALARQYFFNYKGIGVSLNNIKVPKNDSHIKDIITTIWPNTWRDGLVTISNYFLNQATTVIASLYLTLSETGIYSMCVQLVSAVATIAGTLYTAYQPTLQSAYSNRDIEKQRKSMSAIVLSFCILHIGGVLTIVLVWNPILKLVKPSYLVSIPVVLLIGLYQFMLKYRNCYCSYLSTTNRLIYAKSFVASAMICVVLSLFSVGVFNFGVYGLITAQIMSQSVFNVWYWPRMVKRELNLNAQMIFKDGRKELIKLISGKKHTESVK